MIEKIHQYIIENNSTIFKTKTLTLNDFKTVFDNASKEDREFIENTIKEDGYLTYSKQQDFLFKLLKNIVLSNNKPAFDIMRKHEILPKQTKSKKQIPDQQVLDFLDFIEDRLNTENVELLKEVFNVECVFGFYNETALKRLCTHLIKINNEDILFLLIKANVGTVKVRKDLYADIHRELYGDISMYESKFLKSKLSFLKERYEKDSYEEVEEDF